MTIPPFTEILVIDIETVPQVPQFQDLTEEWKDLWLAKISKTVPENISAEEFYPERAGILAEFGKIICISTGYFYHDTNHDLCFKIKSISGDDEKKVLNDFIDLVSKFAEKRKKFQFAGHNIREFDIPFLCRRMLAQDTPIPPYLSFSGMKPWETNILDTLQLWKFGDYKNYISLRLLAAVLNVPTPKDDMDGSMVRSVYYEDHNLSRIADYCQKDVVAVANILCRLKHKPILAEQQVVISPAS